MEDSGGELGVSDEVASLIEALAYAQTRARKAEGIVEDYDLRIQAAVLKAMHWVQNAKNELNRATKEQQGIQRELAVLHKRRGEWQRWEEKFNTNERRWVGEGEEDLMGSIWESSLVVVDTEEEEREEENETYSSSINVLSSRLAQSAKELELIQGEYESRCSLLNQLEVFVGPLLFWRSRTSEIANPHVHQKLTAIMNEMEQHHGTQMFENVARRLLDMHHSSRDRKKEDERKEKEKEGEQKEEGGEQDAFALLNQRLLEAQQKLSESEGRNDALKEELQEMVRLLEEERERRIAAEHRLAELEALMMGHRNEHSIVHIGGSRDKRRETLLQCYASSGFPTNKAKSLDGSDDMELSGVHLAVDMMVHWLFKTIQRCENMFSLASSKLLSSLPGDDRT